MQSVMIGMSSAQTESISGFERFNLGPALLRAVAAAGYHQPRPIQAETIPAALSGRDVLGLAQTGTGKTAAFAIPVLEKLLARPGRGPRVLVLAPTRELARQIDAEICMLARATNIKTAVIYGGVSDRSQIQRLAAHPEIIVACPGRLLDLFGKKFVRLDRIETLVLDEADHMFDLGFLPDIRRIIAALPASRQNLLFAATMPPEIRRLADQVLRDPAVTEFAHSVPPETIHHALYRVAESRKLALLQHVLSNSGFVSAIVFTRTKHRAKRLAVQLGRIGHKAVALQGNMNQRQRDRSMQGFRDRHFDILVATDIASRGIDVFQVSHVINFDVPNTPDAYTHRIGRTGRSGRSGQAYTFVSETDLDAVRAIERRLGAKILIDEINGFDSALESERSSLPRDAGRGPGFRRKRFSGRRRRRRG